MLSLWYEDFFVSLQYRVNHVIEDNLLFWSFTFEESSVFPV